MNEAGFLPMSFAAVLMLAMVILFMAHVSEVGVRLQSSEAASAHELASAAAMMRSQLNGTLRYAAYAALQEVSENAWKYNSEEKLRRIEDLTADYFHNGLKDLTRCTDLDPRIRLDVPCDRPEVSLMEDPDGGVMVRASFPRVMFLRLVSRDEKISIVIPIEELSLSLNSRYFLLQNLMENFLERMGDANTYWGVAEYLASWGEAWTTGAVILSRARTVALFEAAWTLHEFNVFGSADCSAMLLSTLSEICLPSMRGSGAGPEAHVKEIGRCTREALSTLARHEEKLGRTLDEIRKAEILPENEFPVMIKNVVERLVEVKDELNRTRDLLLALGENGGALSPEGKPSITGQLPLCLEGLSDKINAALENLLLAESSASPNERLRHLEKAANLLAELTTISGTVGSADVQDALGRWYSFPVFVNSPKDATLPRIRSILEGTLHDLEVLSDLPTNDGDPSGFQELLSKVSSIGPIPNREDLFSVFPQEPLKGDHGVSAFHKLRIEEVKFRREDPAGQIGLELATPIPLWFIGVTVWWGQWEVTLKLGQGSVEVISDFTNKTIPQFTDFEGAHVPLKYRWSFNENEFKIRVVVASLKPFLIKMHP